MNRRSDKQVVQYQKESMFSLSCIAPGADSRNDEPGVVQRSLRQSIPATICSLESAPSGFAIPLGMSDGQVGAGVA